MFDLMDADLFDAFVLLGFAVLMLMVSTVLAGVALGRWLDKRRRAKHRAGLHAAATDSIQVAGELAGKTVKVTKLKAGRTKKAKAIATASHLLEKVDEK